MENCSKTGNEILNLGKEEYIAAVENQAKPLIIPLCIETSLPDLSPLDVYSTFQKRHGFLLESMEGSDKIARYSFIGIDPALIITIDGTVELKGDEQFVSIAEYPKGDTAIDKIRSILQRFNFVNVKAPRFFGGMVGYFSYDLAYSLYTHLEARETEPKFPTAQFMLIKDCIVFDHMDEKMFIFSSPFLTYDSDLEEEYEKSRSKILEIREILKNTSRNEKTENSQPQHTQRVLSSNMSKEEFQQAVLKIQEYIYAGDIFQAVLSRRVECTLDTDTFALYQALRKINPSPYMYFLDFEDLQVVGSSPEMLVRVENRNATTVPIAGTRLRGTTAEEDNQLAMDLLSDEKERAEHAMLVDLARNDLGRVCKFGSVRLSDFMTIEKFSHVQHIVSTVQGELRDNLDCYDALKSCFPAGTVSGAPKLRAMQIIEEVENDRRGIYSGAVGYVGFDRNLEFAITIRTIVAHEGKAYFQVGAGIVADSVPKKEWIETENKGKAMLSAIEMAELMQ
jgi:anthranilate synthase component 1